VPSTPQPLHEATLSVRWTALAVAAVALVLMLSLAVAAARIPAGANELLVADLRAPVVSDDEAASQVCTQTRNQRTIRKLHHGEPHNISRQRAAAEWP
jgi:hypothetical protein